MLQRIKKIFAKIISEKMMFVSYLLSRKKNIFVIVAKPFKNWIQDE
jgi:hypothetical protein